MLYYDVLISFGYYSCLGIFGQPFTVRVNRTFRLNDIFFYDVFFDRKKKMVTAVPSCYLPIIRSDYFTFTK